MGILENLKAKSDDAGVSAQNVKDMILGDFREYVYSEQFEEDIEDIANNYIKERRATIEVSFWQHVDGCSSTRFMCGRYLWRSPNAYEFGEYDRKADMVGSVYLFDIHKDVVNELRSMVVNRLNAIGFDCVEAENQTGRMGYLEYYIRFSW